MKALFLLLLASSIASADPGTITIKPPKHAYIAFGHMPQILHTPQGNDLVVLVARDKKGDEIMVGVYLDELRALLKTFLEPQIDYQ